MYPADALDWIKSAEISSDSSFVASLPDISEFPDLTESSWRDWFVNTAELILNKTPANGVTVFFQSDIRLAGRWVDKGYLCYVAAERSGHSLVWHKIAARVAPGKPTFGRAGYSHILCFARGVTAKFPPPHSTPDILEHVGEKTWTRGMGLDACLFVAKFIAQQIKSRVIINPFCGHGSMLAAANAVGCDAIGIEKSPKRAKKAGLLQLDLETHRWITDFKGQQS